MVTGFRRPHETRHELVGRILVVVTAVFLAGSAGGQVVGEIPSGGNLNVFSAPDYRTSEPVPVARDDVALVIQTLSSNVPSLAAYLLVLRGVDGRPIQDFVAIPNLGAGEVWHRIFQLTPGRAVMPGSGLDGVFSTLDDELLVIDGLDDPGQMSVQRLPLHGLRGPRPGAHVLVLDDRTIAWLDAGADWTAGTHDDGIVAAVLGDGGVELQDVAVPLSGIDASFVCDMEPNRYGLRSLGADGQLGTADDAVGMIWKSGDLVQVAMAAAGPILDLSRAPTWPRYLGNGTLLYFTSGAEYADFAFVRGFDTVPEVMSYPAPRGVFLPQETGPNLAPITENAVMLMPSRGADLEAGTADDTILRVMHPDDGDYVRALEVPQTLAGRDGLPELNNDLYYLGEDVCIAPHSGDDFNDDTDDGLLVLRGASGNAPAIDLFPTFESVAEVVPMGRGSAAVILDSGLVFYLLVHGSNIYSLPATGKLFKFESEPRALSPSLFCALEKGTDGSDPVDVVQLWRMPASYCYGDASPNGLGFDMTIGSDRLVPAQGQPFKVTLESAPPSSLAYLVCAMRRAALPITGQVDLLLHPAAIVGAWPWFTLPNGAAALSFTVPDDRDLRGLTLSFQWIVHSPDSPRRFETSSGLSLAF